MSEQSNPENPTQQAELEQLATEINDFKDRTESKFQELRSDINRVNHKRKKDKAKVKDLENQVDSMLPSRDGNNLPDIDVEPSSMDLLSENNKDDVEKKDEDPKKSKEPVQKIPYSKLYSFADKWDALLIFLGTIGAIIHGAVMPAFAFLFGELVDELSTPDRDVLFDTIQGLTPWFLVAGAAALVSTYMQTAFFQITAQRQITKIRDAYLKAMMRQEVAWFDRNGTGALISRISGDTAVMKEGFGEKIGSMIQFIAMFFVGFGMGFYRGWELSLVLCAVTPLLIAAGAVMMKIFATLTTRGQAAYASAGSIAQEALISMRTVTSFAAQDRFTKLYNEKLFEARSIGQRKGFLTGISLGIIMALFFLTWSLGLWYGATLTSQGEYTIGKVFTVFFSIIIGAFALGQAAPSFEAIGAAQGAGYKLFETLARNSEIDAGDDKGIKPEQKLTGRIEFKDVVFRYPTRPDVVVAKKLNFSVKPGQTVALVGESGSGKSSIVSLLQRFYDTESGEVLIDGVNIKDYNLKWYRGQCGYVGQEPVLFSGTIAENIAFGLKEKPDMKEIESVAKLANAHNFIKHFPDGYNTQVGERGAKLSGGQKQRVAIARALLMNPSLMLLDEATSALDSKSERVVQAALDQIMLKHTTIVVAHRLSTIRNADCIYVLDRGQIIESGTHEALMAMNGRYANLVRLQGGDKDEKKLATSQEISRPQAEEEEDEEENSQEKSTKKPDDKEEQVKTGCCGAKKKEEKKEELYQVSLGRIAKMNASEIPYILIALIGALINGGIQPAFSFLFSNLTDILIKVHTSYLLYGYSEQTKETTNEEITPWVLGFVGVAFAAFVANVIQAGFFGVAGEKLTERLRALTFKSMVRQDIGWFDNEKHSSGVLTSRLATETPLIATLLGTRLGLTLQNIITILACLGIAFYYSWELTLVILATFPLISISSGIEMATRKGFTGNIEKATQAANQVASEAISSIRTVVAFTAEDRVIERYQHYLLQPHQLAIRTGHISGFVSGFGQLLLFSCYALHFWVGAKFIQEEIIEDPADFIYVLMAILMAATSLGQSSALAPNLGEAQVAAAHIFETIDTIPPIDSFSDQGLKPAVEGEIQLKGIRFSYPTRKNQQIFENLDLEIKQGQVVALVGASGCGKSTIIQLLERFYDPEQGIVTIDNRNIRDINLNWLRQQIGLVSQEPILFTGSIADNIRMGKPDATMPEVIQAATLANAHKFISSFPQGYDTAVGEKGGQLSGGQKQRIAIARAIIKNPKILLLDEATSALDTESEKVVQKALDKVMKDRTVVVVAHRLSTIKNADQIYVLDSGKIVENGTHEELLAKKGFYYALNAKASKHSGFSDSKKEEDE